MIEVKSRKEPSGVMMIDGTLHKVVDFELLQRSEDTMFGHTFRVNTVEPTADEKLIHEIDNFDWYYMMSDDQRVWRRGERAKLALDIKLRTASEEVCRHYDKVCPHGKS